MSTQILSVQKCRRLKTDPKKDEKISTGSEVNSSKKSNVIHGMLGTKKKSGFFID